MQANKQISIDDADTLITATTDIKMYADFLRSIDSEFPPETDSIKVLGERLNDSVRKIQDVCLNLKDCNC